MDVKLDEALNANVVGRSAAPHLSVPTQWHPGRETNSPVHRITVYRCDSAEKAIQTTMLLLYDGKGVPAGE